MTHTTATSITRRMFVDFRPCGQQGRFHQVTFTAPIPLVLSFAIPLIDLLVALCSSYVRYRRRRCCWEFLLLCWLFQDIYRLNVLTSVIFQSLHVDFRDKLAPWSFILFFIFLTLLANRGQRTECFLPLRSFTGCVAGLKAHKNLGWVEESSIPGRLSGTNMWCYDSISCPCKPIPTLLSPRKVRCFFYFERLHRLPLHLEMRFID